MSSLELMKKICFFSKSEGVRLRKARSLGQILILPLCWSNYKRSVVRVQVGLRMRAVARHCSLGSPTKTMGKQNHFQRSQALN